MTSAAPLTWTLRSRARIERQGDPRFDRVFGVKSHPAAEALASELKLDPRWT